MKLTNSQISRHDGIDPGIFMGTVRKVKLNRHIYLFLLPGLIFYLIFSYAPMYGITLAFKEYFISKGIIGSPWVGLKNFELLSKDPEFYHAFFNTLRISAFNIIVGFPAPIILAVLINEMANGPFKKCLQTIYTFPHFLSWVLVSGIMINFLSSNGIVNQILDSLGFSTYEFLADISIIRPILYATNVWKGAGWSSIIYLAAIANINPELYEAAMMDGASRLQRILHITWPGIKGTSIILLVLAVGGVMNAGFDQIFNLSNPVVRDATEIIDTYVYRITFDSSIFDYGFSTAVGFFKSVINFVLLVTANKVVKLMGGGGIF